MKLTKIRVGKYYQYAAFGSSIFQVTESITGPGHDPICKTTMGNSGCPWVQCSKHATCSKHYACFYLHSARKNFKAVPDLVGILAPKDEQ